MNCTFCYNYGVHDEESFTLPHGALDYFKGLVIFHGGEPMLNTDYIDAVYDEYKDNEHIKFSITTNLLTNTHKLKEYLYKWKNCDFIKVSYDVSGRFKAGQYIEFMRNLKDIYKISNKKDLIVNICLTKDLISIDPKVIYDRFARYSDGLNFEFLTNDSMEDISSMMPSYSDIDEWLLDLYRIYKDNKCSLYISNFDDLRKAAKGIHIGCRARQCSKTVRTIDTDGKIYGCPNTIFKADGCLGFIKDRQVYTYDNNVKSNNDVENGTFPSVMICLTCDLYSICNQGCYQLKWQHGEDRLICPGMIKLMTAIKEDIERGEFDE